MHSVNDASYVSIYIREDLRSIIYQEYKYASRRAHESIMHDGIAAPGQLGILSE